MHDQTRKKLLNIFALGLWDKYTAYSKRNGQLSENVRGKDMQTNQFGIWSSSAQQESS